MILLRWDWQPEKWDCTVQARNNEKSWGACGLRSCSWRVEARVTDWLAYRVLCSSTVTAGFEFRVLAFASGAWRGAGG